VNSNSGPGHQKKKNRETSQESSSIKKTRKKKKEVLFRRLSAAGGQMGSGREGILSITKDGGGGREASHDKSSWRKSIGGSRKSASAWSQREAHRGKKTAGPDHVKVPNM